MRLFFHSLFKIRGPTNFYLIQSEFPSNVAKIIIRGSKILRAFLLLIAKSPLIFSSPIERIGTGELY